MSTQEPVRKRLSRSDRRKSILKTAIDVFAEKGYAATTTAGLAEAAGVSEALIYQHFASKRELFLAVMELTRKRFERQLSPWLMDPDLTVAEVTRKALEITREEITTRGTLARLSLIALSELADPEIRAAVNDTYERIVQTIAAAVSAGSHKGRIPAALDPQVAGWLMISFFQLLSVLQQLGRLDELSWEKIEPLVKQIYKIA